MNAREAFHFRLYVTSNAPNSTRALANLTEFCRCHLDGRHHIDVVDLNLEPRRALQDRVYMTPTLIKLAPGVEARVVGCLTDHGPLLVAFGLPLRNS
jgi:circadian clock protein KaiB